MAKAKSKAKVESMIDRDKVKGYKVTDSVRTPSGRKAIDCDDKVAKMLRGKTLDECKTVARKHKLGERLKDWDHLNPGQQRMAIGNALRKAVRDGVAA